MNRCYLLPISSSCHRCWNRCTGLALTLFPFWPFFSVAALARGVVSLPSALPSRGWVCCACYIESVDSLTLQLATRHNSRYWKFRQVEVGGISCFWSVPACRTAYLTFITIDFMEIMTVSGFIRKCALTMSISVSTQAVHSSLVYFFKRPLNSNPCCIYDWNYLSPASVWYQCTCTRLATSAGMSLRHNQKYSTLFVHNSCALICHARSRNMLKHFKKTFWNRISIKNICVTASALYLCSLGTLSGNSIPVNHQVINDHFFPAEYGWLSLTPRLDLARTDRRAERQQKNKLPLFQIGSVTCRLSPPNSQATRHINREFDACSS